MKDSPPGTYLFRFSNSEPGSFAVDFVTPAGTLDKALIKATYPGVAYTTDAGTEHMYGSLSDLKHDILQHFCVLV